MTGLQHILDDHNMVVCVGCGGVGKTTIAASVALRGALDGRRTLCLTIDPARRLATSLGLGQMRGAEQQVDQLAFIEAGLIMRGELWAAVVDGKATFDGIVQKTAADEETAQRILENRIYRYMSASMPGVQEYMATERLYAAKQNPNFDLVVLDTPPTSNALDFLDAPRRITAAMNSPAVEWLMMMHKGGVLSQGTAFIMRNLSKIAGSNVLERMAELALDFESMLDGMRERAATVAETLRSDEVAYILVTSPDPLAVDEAIFLNHRLVEMGLSGGALVVNRMRPHRPGIIGLGETQIRSQLAESRLEKSTIDSIAAKLARATREEQSLAEADLVQVDRLKRSCENIGSVCLVPGLDRDVYSLEQLNRLHDWLF